MSSVRQIRPVAWTGAPWLWVWMLATTALLLAVFYDGLIVMVEGWSGREEYSHGFVLPIVAGFLVWQKKNLLETLPFEGSWIGSSIVLAGVALYFAGELSALYVVVQYAFLVVLAGLALALLGGRAFKIICAPLLILFFMIPLPNFLYQGLSGQLQLISSQIGVSVIRIFGISVFLEGNVIDLGNYKLQVAEACSGLRYLFPLMALSFIAAYLYNGAFWKRVLIFLSSIPITILMNSFRIGAIGVLVDRWGVSMAEGFLHDFEGWAIFMACTGVLVGEMWVLTKLGSETRSFGQVFQLQFPSPSAAGSQFQYRPTPKPFIAGTLLLAIVAMLSFALPPRVEASEPRKSFYEFPLSFDKWRGTAGRLEQFELDALKLDDYILADFVGPHQRVVNFYAAYYATQRKGESAHSPRSCIPGGGWEIADLTQRDLGGVRAAGHPLRVNRVLIQRGDKKQLVYYWFQQRGRIITNEYLVKWYLLWDAMTRNRTDGALIRLVAYVGPGQSIEDADTQLTAFAASVARPLENYVPD
jgi:exosortase D (VPLPA-CTERM-specific)